ncbi:DNA internalization-related competence protein ComEC/Rec2 [Shewanella mesophila]|uniref:DNA internalization-related competence protein ComEC/Rec2 n=1 Tax=Shewanella mesophila TaxID=2864208 RepID=UPI001C655F79|nr:DNA internalization-related competence protein ComEC/Rec2 [Shewanella mesophila]QYJ87561.1 DNA internalization-related competence protein ComEC/Rec2 [Shewanella mesophila]
MFGYCATIISALLWPSLLSASQAWYCIGAALVLLRWSRLIAGGLFAVAWISLFCHQLLVFNSIDNDANISVRAEIISLVYRNSDWISADIRVLDNNSSILVTQYMRVAWPLAAKANVGEQWQLKIKPKSISSPLNQGGFNRQRYYLSKHIIGKGKVVAAERIEVAAGVRSSLISQFTQTVSGFQNGDLILALMLGNKQLITTDHWQGLKQSGTGHLISISGLHLSVLALWCIALMRIALSRFRPTPTANNLHLAAMFALLACFVYAYLAGFALPTQRALIMLGLVIILSVLRRYSTPFERLLWALFVVLLLDPVSMMSAGFWLSFSALAIILGFSHAQSREISTEVTSLWQRFKLSVSQLWSLQWRLSLLLGVLQMLLFGGAAPLSLLFNVIFVPWFSLVVIPLTFILMLCYLISGGSEVVTTALLTLLDSTISPLTWSFSLLQSFPYGWVSVSSQLSVVVVYALLALLILRIITKSMWRCLLTILLLPGLLLLLKPWSDDFRHDWKLHLLDVGQGLSAVIEKQGRVVIYDTGAAFGSNFSYAKQAIIPFLQYRGITDVDYLILSHGDNDHAGGADDIIAQYPQLQLITDLDYHQAMECRPSTFYWQALTVRILGPTSPMSGNNGSCVVQFSDGVREVLLPGDIEIDAEQALIKQYGDSLSSELRSSVLVAPHHGSNTSSSNGFISAVSPDLVFYPAGLNNRYGFPKSEVVSRYENAGVTQYSLDVNGQLSVIFEQDGVKVNSFRYDISPFWYNRVFEFGVFGNTE